MTLTPLAIMPGRAEPVECNKSAAGHSAATPFGLEKLRGSSTGFGCGLSETDDPQGARHSALKGLLST